MVNAHTPTGPTFITPGAQKSGTTWLNKQLRAHPDFWMPPQKEMDYLFFMPPSRKKYLERLPKVMLTLEQKNNEQAIEWWKLFASEWSLEKYSQLFLPAGDKFSGDISPNYARMNAEAIERAAKFAPNSKIVILLRDPVERAWSHARYTIERGSDKSLPVEERIAKMAKFAKSENCLLMGDYPRLVQNWRGAFGRDATYVAFYDDIVNKPMELMNGILSFLGAPPMPPALEKTASDVVNRGPQYNCPDELKSDLKDMYSSMIQ